MYLIARRLNRCALSSTVSAVSHGGPGINQRMIVLCSPLCAAPVRCDCLAFSSSHTFSVSSNLLRISPTLKCFFFFFRLFSLMLLHAGSHESLKDHSGFKPWSHLSVQPSQGNSLLSWPNQNTSPSQSSSDSFLCPSLRHLCASSHLSTRSNNIYFETTGPRKAVEGAPKELAIVAN